MIKEEFLAGILISRENINANDNHYPLIANGGN